MQLEDQVTSLALSMRLKNLGLHAESLFFWYRGLLLPLQHVPLDDHGKAATEIEDELYPAFTVGELGALLPKSIGSRRLELFWTNVNGVRKWVASYSPSFFDTNARGESEHEAEARAQMLIWLMENHALEQDP